MDSEQKVDIPENLPESVKLMSPSFTENTAMPIVFVPTGENSGVNSSGGNVFTDIINRTIDHVNREIGVAQEVPLHERLALLEDLCTKTFAQIKAKFNY